MSGSVTLEDFAMLGGAVGLAPHVTIGKGGRVAARSGLMHDVPPGETWAAIRQPRVGNGCGNRPPWPAWPRQAKDRDSFDALR